MGRGQGSGTALSAPTRREETEASRHPQLLAAPAAGVMLHLADERDRDSIRLHGLLPARPQMPGGKRGVYLYAEEWCMHEAQAGYAPVTGFDIWEVDARGLELQRDPSYPEGFSYCSREAVPPALIRLARASDRLPDTGDPRPPFT